MRLPARMTACSAGDDNGDDAGQDGRRAPRADVQVDARLRRREGKAIIVEILDLATLGFRAETWGAFPQGSQVWLTLPGLEAVLATVMWADQAHIGCAFAQPLHPAVVARFVTQSGVPR